MGDLEDTWSLPCSSVSVSFKSMSTNEIIINEGRETISLCNVLVFNSYTITSVDHCLGQLLLVSPFSSYDITLNPEIFSKIFLQPAWSKSNLLSVHLSIIW